MHKHTNWPWWNVCNRLTDISAYNPVKQRRWSLNPQIKLPEILLMLNIINFLSQPKASELSVKRAPPPRKPPSGFGIKSFTLISCIVVAVKRSSSLVGNSPAKSVLWPSSVHQMSQQCVDQVSRRSASRLTNTLISVKNETFLAGDHKSRPTLAKG